MKKDTLKRRYLVPKLKKYGKVSQITLGAGSHFPDVDSYSGGPFLPDNGI
jgi:hypothetical protein